MLRVGVSVRAGVEGGGNIISYNVMGLGRGEKRVEVRKLVHEKNPLVLCLQEIKMVVLNDFMVKSVWGDTPFGYSYQPSLGASGGLATVWDASRINIFVLYEFRSCFGYQGQAYNY